MFCVYFLVNIIFFWNIRNIWNLVYDGHMCSFPRCISTSPAHVRYSPIPFPSTQKELHTTISLLHDHIPSPRPTSFQTILYPNPSQPLPPHPKTQRHLLPRSGNCARGPTIGAMRRFRRVGCGSGIEKDAGRFWGPESGRWLGRG